ncbi:PRC-barrel domain-containing protein [Nocardioides sp. InS609-2]|uniref:PRC-barrel domain-containing protein n=1 Tax=Nocardioides sp. InS609-2 TaxID=2760705 RepID=UPI0020BE03A5|nr:PRC-barrel domain-containing protein [Nocardioides sp. InS609-2]
MTNDNVWNYRDTSWSSEGGDFVGYDVEATDGSIGKIDEASNDASGSHVVVDTGFWIFGKKRLIPAGAVTGVDHENKLVRVDMTKDQIKSAPDYDKDAWSDDSRGEHGDYYGPYSRG